MDWLTSKSWKTTATGIGTIFAALGQIGIMLKSGQYDWNVMYLAAMQIIPAFGLIFAKDRNVVGAPPTDKAK